MLKDREKFWVGGTPFRVDLENKMVPQLWQL